MIQVSKDLVCQTAENIKATKRQDTFKSKGSKSKACHWHRCGVFKGLYGVYVLSSVMDNQVFLNRENIRYKHVSDVAWGVYLLQKSDFI